ncbi:MAG: thiol-disulfide oxidoreductase DCC family protein [Thermomonas sp.]
MPQPDTGGAVIVFDGVCVLCNGWVGFLLRHDRRGRYRFAAMQSDAGRALLGLHGLDPDDPASFLLIEHDVAEAPRVSTDSDAIRRVLVGLGGGWQLANVIALVPRGLRDPAYRWLARNRYLWFGKHDACSLPAPEHRQRFL